MQYHFPYESFSPTGVSSRSSPRWRSNDFSALKYSLGVSRDNSLDPQFNLASPHNSPEQVRSPRGDLYRTSIQLSPLPTDGKNKHNNSEQRHQNSEQRHQNSEQHHHKNNDMQMQPRPDTELAGLGPSNNQAHDRQAPRQPEKQFGQDWQELSSEGLSDLQVEYRQPNCHQSIRDGLSVDQDRTVRDLLERCDNQCSVIDTYEILQRFIADEMMRLGMLNDEVSLQLADKSRRLHEQVSFLETIQAPSWTRAVIADLGTRVSERASAHKARATCLVEESHVIQRSLDGPGTTDGAQCSDKQQNASSETERIVDKSKPSTEPRWTDDNALDVAFLETRGTFDRARRSWMRLVGLLEYQQEQWDSTVALISQADNELQEMIETSAAGTDLWKVLLQRKDLQSRIDSLEARKEHLETQVRCVKAELDSFELANKDVILSIDSSLGQHRARYDRNLKHQLQLLTNTVLIDPASTQIHTSLESEDSGSGEATPADTRLNKAALLPSTATLSGSSPNRTQVSINRLQDSKCAGDVLCALPAKQVHGWHDSGRLIASKQKVERHSRLPGGIESPIPQKTLTINPASLEQILNMSLNAFEISVATGLMELHSPGMGRARKQLSPLTTAGKAVEDYPPERNLLKCENKTVIYTKQPNRVQTETSKKYTKGETTKTISTNDKDGEHADIRHIYSPSTSQKDVSCLDLKSEGPEEREPDKIPAIRYACNMPYLRTGKTMKEILSMKEKRAAYFISKYAGGKHNGRAHLAMGVSSVQPLSTDKEEDIAKKPK